MPRIIDWSARPQTEKDLNKTKLAEPLFGLGELPRLDEPRLHHPEDYNRYPQFVMMNPPADDKRGTYHDAVFLWLENNCAGPWHFVEEWDELGMRFGLRVFIERRPDQEKMKHSAFARDFKFMPESEKQIFDTAVINGFIPEPDPKQSLNLWMREQREKLFSVTEFVPVQSANIMSVKFHDKELGRDFITVWGIKNPEKHRFHKTENPGEYRGTEYYSEGATPSLWLEYHTIRTEGPDNYGKMIVHIRHREIEESFAGDWGKRFAPDGFGKYHGIYREPGKATIPPTFLDYLDGRMEITEARSRVIPPVPPLGMRL